LRHTGPHHSRRGHLSPSCHIGAHTRVLPCAIPQGPLLVARLVRCRRCDTRCRLRPRGDGWCSSKRTARMACARPEGIGSLPKYSLLGARFQIQGNTLHLVSLVVLTVGLAPSGRHTSERLTRPYSGELPAGAVLSQRATIARSPRSCDATFRAVGPGPGLTCNARSIGAPLLRDEPGKAAKLVALRPMLLPRSPIRGPLRS